MNLRRALLLRGEVGDRAGVAITLADPSLVLNEIGDRDAALDALQRTFWNGGAIATSAPGDLFRVTVVEDAAAQWCCTGRGLDGRHTRRRARPSAWAAFQVVGAG